MSYSHQAKARAKTKKIKEQVKKDQRLKGKHQRKFSLSRSVLRDVNWSLD